jgi:hypothetical protein
MPKIGCDQDSLKWQEVLNMIHELYQDTDVQITIYHDEDNSKGGKGRGKESGPNPHGFNDREDWPPFPKLSNKQRQIQGNMQEYTSQPPSRRGEKTSQEELPELAGEKVKQEFIQ